MKGKRQKSTMKHFSGAFFIHKFDRKLRAKIRHTASSLSSVTKTIFASSSANRITKTKNCDYKIFIFSQALNSNFRLSANRAAVLFVFKQFTENLFIFPGDFIPALRGRHWGRQGRATCYGSFYECLLFSWCFIAMVSELTVLIT